MSLNHKWVNSANLTWKLPTHGWNESGSTLNIHCLDCCLLTISWTAPCWGAFHPMLWLDLAPLSGFKPAQPVQLHRNRCSSESPDSHPDIPFPVGVTEFVHHWGSQWAGDERCHWRALSAGFLCLPSVSTTPFVSLSLNINKFSQYFEGLCLFITPANTRHVTLYPQKRKSVCTLPQSSYCKYFCIVARPLCEIQMPFADY